MNARDCSEQTENPIMHGQDKSMLIFGRNLGILWPSTTDSNKYSGLEKISILFFES
jgi:hypothetical protein